MPEPPEAALGQGTVLGFDFGLKRLGVAIGQAVTATAQPLTTLTARDGAPDWEAVAGLIAQWRPTALVVGMPRNLDGSAHALAPRVERFCRQLQGRFALPVYTVDERLSSREAEARLKQARRAGRRGRVQKLEIDSLSAAIVLETWLSGAEHEH